MSDKPSLLIVDDEPEIFWALEKVLKRSGYNCFKALSGQEAMALAETIQFRLIFLDAKLPDIEGLELARQIHRSRPGSEIVMISGYYYQDDEDIKRALSSGLIRHFISKPFDHKEILRIVRGYLAN